MIRQSTDPATGVAALLLLVMVVTAPLPYGSVLPRERLVLEILGLLALAARLLSRRDLGALGRAAAPALALAAVGVFGWLQSLPWPPFVAAGLMPRSAEVWKASAALAGESARWIPLSFSPPVSRSVALLWLAVAATLAAACGVAPGRRLRRALAVGALATTVFEIAYGARHWFEGSAEIWGRPLAGGFDRLRGTFVNPDHFAMFLIVALAANFAWVWWSMRRALWTSHLALERRLLYVLLPWFFFVMLFVGLAFTGSRAGFVGALAALAVQGLLLALDERRWQASLLGLGALGVGLTSLLYFGWQRGMARWLATSAYEITWNTRLEVYASSLELWRAFPWTGTGLGTFRQAFPLVQPPDLELAWFHAHSDPLELLVTTGIVGPALVGWGLVAVFRRLWHNLRWGRRSEDRAMVLSAWGALVGALAHSLTDFGLTLPANAFLLAVVVGLACGVDTRPPEPPGDESRPPAP